ncbi:hypothetical protein HZB58_02340 [Candidatus Gottesmanbacteria bacterium]|nr:hypothetical protein [Candidatus Gottesmanbacteria bacterium]
MSRQGVRISVHTSMGNELLREAGIVAPGERPVRTAVLHIHLDNPSKRFRRMMSDLDSMVSGHTAWFRGKKWQVASAETVESTRHQGHIKDKGHAFEYFLEDTADQ